jgi:SAM-dependent methyltransferase
MDVVPLDFVENVTSPETVSRPRGTDVHLRSALQMREYLDIAARVARESPGPVLDWGCGHGQITDLLRKDAVDVTAFDWSPKAALDGEIVPLKDYPDIEAHHSSDPVRLPFPDHSFQYVLSCGVLEHVQRPDDSLEEVRRVLRPAGRLLIYKLPNRFSYLEAIARLMGIYYHGALPNDRVYTRRTAIALVLRHGFHVDASRLTNMLPLTITHPLVRALAKPIWALNSALGRMPAVRLLATNIELEATAR